MEQLLLAPLEHLVLPPQSSRPVPTPPLPPPSSACNMSLEISFTLCSQYSTILCYYRLIVSLGSHECRSLNF